ncbi:MAG: hypothetical protein ABUK03_03635 [Dehalococcoidales bacterium]
MYAGDGSAEYREFCLQMEQAKSQYRANQTMNFHVDPGQGHDDFLMSLALLVEAAARYSPRGAGGRAAPRKRFPLSFWKRGNRLYTLRLRLVGDAATAQPEAQCQQAQAADHAERDDGP